MVFELLDQHSRTYPGARTGNDDRSPRFAPSRTAALPITHIHTYLVHPSKGVDKPEPVGGSELLLTGNTNLC